MKITILMVTSLNGKITRGEDPSIYAWTSQEDKDLFFSMIEKHSVIIMGRKTYEAARSIIKHKKGKLRIVLTRNPESYKDQEIADQLEFTAESPEALVERLSSRGLDEALLVGGGEINTSFLSAKLVDEIHLTIEPIIFGMGRNVIGDSDVEVQLRLLETKKLNERGTLHLRYKVLKNHD